MIWQFKHRMTIYKWYYSETQQMFRLPLHNAIIQYLKLPNHFPEAFGICKTSVTDFLIWSGAHSTLYWACHTLCVRELHFLTLAYPTRDHCYCYCIATSCFCPWEMPPSFHWYCSRPSHDDDTATHQFGMWAIEEYHLFVLRLLSTS